MTDENIENVKSHLASITKFAIEWFERNCMQVIFAPGHKKLQTDFSIDKINIEMNNQ